MLTVGEGTGWTVMATKGKTTIYPQYENGLGKTFPSWSEAAWAMRRMIDEGGHGAR